MNKIYENTSDHVSELSIYNYNDKDSNLKRDSYRDLQKVTEYYDNKRDATDFSDKLDIIKHLVNKEEKQTVNKFNCKLCCTNNSSNTSNNYIILSCDHIFHINCLVELHFKDIYNYHVIDNEYFENRKCTVCDKQIQFEEIMYLHSKFLSNTKFFIKTHQLSIDELEEQLKNIKNELRICYDYKHKLEKNREKSKQIVSILATMDDI